MSQEDRHAVLGDSTIRGVLIDVDGTLLEADAPLPGAGETLRRLREQRIPFRLTTNTTRRPRSATAAALSRAGIDVAPGEVIVPASLARARILDSGRARAGLLVPEATKQDLDGVQEDGSSPDWVVVGDLGPGFTFERLNQAFRWLRGGAGFIALHNNGYWRGEDGLLLDAGAFVAALEYASGVKAEVMGKPSRLFFELALKDLGLPAPQVISVGDSLENDCLGAAAAGCRCALVKTGIFDPSVLARSSRRPDHLLDSIADLVAD